MTEQQRHEELLRGYAESGECARGGTLWLDDIRVLLAALDTAREERDAAAEAYRQERDVLIEKLRIERGYNEGLRQERDAAMEALAAAEAREAALLEALAFIRDSKHCIYDQNGGDAYGNGVTDGHRYCSNVARAALAGERNPYLSSNLPGALRKLDALAATEPQEGAGT